MSTNKLLITVAALGLCVTVAACKTTPPPKPMGKALKFARLYTSAQMAPARLPMQKAKKSPSL